MSKPFSIIHIIQKASTIEEKKYQFSTTVQNSNIHWRLCFYHEAGQLDVFMQCAEPAHAGHCLIKATFEIRLMLVDGTLIFARKFINTEEYFSTETSFNGIGFQRIARWDDIKEVLVGDQLILESIVTIVEMEGVLKLKHRDFDDKELSDVVLNVDGEKFHVLKQYLASQSTYFKSLFLGGFHESKQEEIVLKEVNPDDFQSFLELIHMEPALNDSCIEGVLLISDMYDAKNARRLCEEFLVRDSKHSWKLKIRIAAQYKLEKLKKHVIDNLKCAGEIRSVMGPDLKELDPTILEALVDKSLSLL